MQKSLCPHGTRAATVSPSQHRMHSRFKEPRVLELLLEPTGEAAGEADPDAEADESLTPESESPPCSCIWKAAESELSVEPMAVKGSELILRAGG